MHRADVQSILVSAAHKHGVEIKLGSPVKAVDHDQPAIILESGEFVKTDLIVDADGKSTVT